MYGTSLNSKYNKNQQSEFPLECCSNKHDEEQGHLVGCPMKNDPDLSLYGNASPKMPGPSSSNKLEHHNSSSHDSGYTSNWTRSISKNSSSSIDFMDDEFLELGNLVVDENAQLPDEFETLMQASLHTSPIYKLPLKPNLRRSLSYNEPTTSNWLMEPPLFEMDNMGRTLKRPNAPIKGNRPDTNKRSKVHTNTVFQRSISATEESIMSALQKSVTEPDLIGDFTTTFCLPMVDGRNEDLKSITPTTLAKVLMEEFTNIVASYKIIDCRYPYEYNGGHIRGAINIYNKKQIVQEFFKVDMLSPLCTDLQRRHILIFHCEFSSERGPNLCRFLRNADRNRNKGFYPALYYPELYVLEGGYKSFYGEHSDLCVPAAYTSMLHPEHGNDLSHFRALCKVANRAILNELGLKC